MKFIEELKEYKKQRINAIQSKKDVLKKLQLEYQSKIYQGKALEQQYKICFDDKIFELLVKQNVQTEQLKCEMNKTKSQLELMDIGQLPLKNSEIKKQIDDFVSSFKLKKLKENILLNKEKYINSVKVYSETMAEIESARVEVEELQSIIVHGNKETIKTAFCKAGHYIDIGSSVVSEYVINSVESK